ncbi:hypothetical protein GXW82_41710 [Streptacidiphilus sp. 4-A2]|nr:hypothetical protein [Streptacidiphilus sp. 4-A2]
MARPGVGLQALGSLETADPDTVLEVWETAASIVAGTAVEAEIDLGAPDGPDQLSEDESEAEYAQLEAAREETQGLLDDALQVLYEASAFADTEEEETVSLGVLAALLVSPEGQEPDEEMLGDITSVMVALDPMLQDLAGIGLVDYSPIDPTLFAEEEDADGTGAPRAAPTWSSTRRRRPASAWPGSPRSGCTGYGSGCWRTATTPR